MDPTKTSTMMLSTGMIYSSMRGNHAGVLQQHLDLHQFDDNSAAKGRNQRL
jgi:hypothetical protein